MKQALRNYSHVLQLRTEVVRSQLDSFDAAYALKLLVIVGLIAGLGVLAGIPHALQELTLPEQIDQAVSAARTTTAEIAAVVMPALTKAETATQAVVAVIQEQVARITEQINSVVGSITSGLNAGRAQVDTQVAQVQQNPQVQQLLAQTTVTAAQVEQAISKAPATAEQISALLARANVTPEQATALLQRAGVPTGQIQQVQQLQAQAGAAAVDSAKAQLQPLLDQLSITQEQFNQILAQLSTTPGAVQPDPAEAFAGARGDRPVDQAARGDAGTVGKAGGRHPCRGRQGRAADRHTGQPGRAPVWRMAVGAVQARQRLAAVCPGAAGRHQAAGRPGDAAEAPRGRGPGGRAARAADWPLHPRHGRGHDGPDGRGDPLLCRVSWHSSA